MMIGTESANRVNVEAASSATQRFACRFSAPARKLAPLWGSFHDKDISQSRIFRLRLGGADMRRRLVPRVRLVPSGSAIGAVCAKNGPNLVTELAPVDRLGGEGVGTEVVGPIDRRHVVVDGQHDDGQIPQFLVRPNLL